MATHNANIHNPEMLYNILIYIYNSRPLPSATPNPPTGFGAV